MRAPWQHCHWQAATDSCDAVHGRALALCALKFTVFSLLQFTTVQVEARDALSLTHPDDLHRLQPQSHDVHQLRAVPAGVGGPYAAGWWQRRRASEMSNNTATKNPTGTVDSPKVAGFSGSIYPGVNDVLNQGQSYTIKWAGSGSGNLLITLYEGAAEKFTISESIAVGTNRLAYTVPASFTPLTDAKYRVCFKDTATQQPVRWSAWFFVKAGGGAPQAPEVSGHDPGCSFIITRDQKFI